MPHPQETPAQALDRLGRELAHLEAHRARLLSNQKQHDRARVELERALAHAEGVGDDAGARHADNMLAGMLENLHRVAAALVTNATAISLRQQERDTLLRERAAAREAEALDAALAAVGSAVDAATAYLRTQWDPRFASPAQAAVEAAVQTERERCRVEGKYAPRTPRLYDELARRLPGAFATLRLLLGVVHDQPLALADPAMVTAPRSRGEAGSALARLHSR